MRNAEFSGFGSKSISYSPKHTTEGKPYLSGHKIRNKNQKADKVVNDGVLKSFADSAIFHIQYAKIRVVLLLLGYSTLFP